MSQGPHRAELTGETIGSDHTNPSQRQPTQIYAFPSRSGRAVAAGETKRSGANGKPVGGISKRCIDIFIAAFALILLSPVVLVTSVLIWMTMGRPIFFSQPRVGLNGVPFRCLKFRTMVRDAEARLLSILEKDPQLRGEWETNRKLLFDPRTTRLGITLRKTSIDEIPQLINVLKGDMSCVGPRPIEHAELLRRISRYRRAKCYLWTKPGVTGIWQVSGRSSVTYRRRVAMEYSYAQKWSHFLDLKVLLLTIPAVLRTRDSA
jgi:exopolysaccharide production protein ExoY